MVDTLLAEVDIYELFAQRHCEGRRVKVTLCDGDCFSLFVVIYTTRGGIKVQP